VVQSPTLAGLDFPSFTWDTDHVLYAHVSLLLSINYWAKGLRARRLPCNRDCRSLGAKQMGARHHSRTAEYDGVEMGSLPDGGLALRQGRLAA